MYDVIVLGAGASGLMSAYLCGTMKKKVLLLEHNKQIGRKILISGGGKCNFTNLHTKPKNFVSENPHFSKSSLARYSPWDFIDLIYQHNIDYYEKKLGQLFCSGSAREVIAMLQKECNKTQNVEILLKTKVLEVAKSGEVFKVQTDKQVFEARKVIVATGGLSIPTIGASDIGYKIAKSFGHRIIETRPGLVPFTLSDEILEGHSELSGISMETVCETNGVRFEESVLFTHKGLSGPAILQVSLHWKPKDIVTINFLPKLHLFEELVNLKKKGSRLTVPNLLKRHLPDRFVKKWCSLYMKDEKTFIAGLSGKDIESISLAINQWTFSPKGTEGYRKAEVTRGGVSTDDVSSKTLESKKVEGLYFIGEVLDVTGWLGGFNFQWAWASAHAAAQDIADYSRE